MAQTKKPGKTRNPVTHMRQCRLYRWENADNSTGHFEAFGPYAPRKNSQLMQKAISRKNTWLCVVTAYFLDEDNNYYEERLLTSPIGPIKIASEIELVLELTNELVVEAKSAGNPEHYQDTCTALYLYTPELEAKLDNDELVQEHAEKRAALALKKRQLEPA